MEIAPRLKAESDTTKSSRLFYVTSWIEGGLPKEETPKHISTYQKLFSKKRKRPKLPRCCIFQVPRALRRTPPSSVTNPDRSTLQRSEFGGISHGFQHMAAGQKRVPKKILLVKGKIDQNLWSPRVFFLTHSQMAPSPWILPHFCFLAKSPNTNQGKSTNNGQEEAWQPTTSLNTLVSLAKESSIFSPVCFSGIPSLPQAGIWRFDVSSKGEANHQTQATSRQSKAGNKKQ